MLFDSLARRRGSRPFSRKHLPDIDVSVQGQPANVVCLSIVTAAQKLDISLGIGFMWRNKEGAEYPGERARIRTSGK